MERWENVADVFSITAADALKDKHVLLVDDVITTGATLNWLASSHFLLPLHAFPKNCEMKDSMVIQQLFLSFFALPQQGNTTT